MAQGREGSGRKEKVARSLQSEENREARRSVSGQAAARPKGNGTGSGTGEPETERGRADRERSALCMGGNKAPQNGQWAEGHHLSNKTQSSKGKRE